MDIRLHPTLGLNPRLVEIHCRVCGQVKSDSILLLGDANHRDRCPNCGVWVFGHHSREACPACKGGQLSSWERQVLDEREEIHTNGVCKECQDWMKKGIVFISVLGDPGQKYREWDCSCGHHYAALVEMEKPGLDLHSFTGEKSAFCPKCGKKPKEGTPHKTIEEKNPYRTGKFCVIKDEAVRRMPLRPKELLQGILQARSTFIPDNVWKLLGLPEENIPERTDAPDKEGSGEKPPEESKPPEAPASGEGVPA